MPTPGAREYPMFNALFMNLNILECGIQLQAIKLISCGPLVADGSCVQNGADAGVNVGTAGHQANDVLERGEVLVLGDACIPGAALLTLVQPELKAVGEGRCRLADRS